MDDIIELLRADHRALEEHFTAWEQADYSGLAEFVDLLRVHSRVEEEVFYPSVIRLDDEGEAVVEALHDHRRMRDLAEALQRSADREAAANLARTIRSHIDEEERELMPAAQSRLSAQVLAELAGEAMRLRALMVERPEGDPGASSDGDRSWAEEPLTQDPRVDRSLDATIRRTGGR